MVKTSRFVSKMQIDTIRKSFDDVVQNSLFKIKTKVNEKEVEDMVFTNVTTTATTVQNPKTVYFCAGWFNEKQEKAYNQAMQALKENATVDLSNSYIPLDNQYKDIRVDLHPEYLKDKEWATATFRGDCLGVKSTDVCLAVYLPSAEDVGMGVELGMAQAHGKYILLVVPDKEYGKPINLMSWGVADNVIPMSQLKDFDFNKPKFNFYDGAVY